MNSDDRIPRLAAGCRLRMVSTDETMLLVPEGALRLKGAGREIIERIDGKRDVGQIIADLREQHGVEDGLKIAEEVRGFLEKLHARSVVLFQEQSVEQAP